MHNQLIYFVLFCIMLLPAIGVCQDQENLKNDQLQHLRFDQYILDSTITLGVETGNNWGESYYTYHIDGNVKSYTLYKYFDGERRFITRITYQYDSEDRVIEKISYDSTLVPSVKITTQWFDDLYFTEQVTYRYVENTWIPNSKIINLELGQPDFYTTYSLNWKSSSQSWDSISKRISYLNTSNKKYVVHEFSLVQGIWNMTIKTAYTYNTSDYVIYDTSYYTSDNGVNFELFRFTDYEYNENNLMTVKSIRYTWHDQWDYYSWSFDTLNRLVSYYYLYQSPAFPVIQGGLVYKNYYDNLGLIHHRNNYNTQNGIPNHISTEYYYYSEFTVDISNPKVINDLCYPNPTTSIANFILTLSEPSPVQIAIYNALGNKVDYINENKLSGRQKISWDASGHPPGIYFYHLEAGTRQATGKLIITR